MDIDTLRATLGDKAKRVEQIGGQILVQGDCLEVMPLLGKVDAVVTDPPYGVGLTAKTTKHGKKSASHNYYDETEHILGIVTRAVENAREIAPCVLVTPGVRLLQRYPIAASIGTIFSANGAGNSSWGFTGNHPILYYGKCPYLSNKMGSRPDSFYSAHPGMHVTGENNFDHPCPKPIAWMNWLVLRASPFKSDTILDPFMGSGTTLVACAKLGRKGIGIELDPDYFEIACKRVQQAYDQPDLFVEPPKQPTQEGMDL